MCLKPILWKISDSDVILPAYRAEKAVPKLSNFIKKYRDYVQNESRDKTKGFRATKVAIIDNGVLSIAPKVDLIREVPGTRQGFNEPGGVTDPESNYEHSPAEESTPSVFNRTRKYKTLWSRIKAGRSFVDDGFRFSPWLFASDPHGTQMANVICAIDPLCELYVAQVTDGRSGITPSRVARVCMPKCNPPL